MEYGNYYDILEVSVKASLEEITAAKNELAKRYHPDSNLKDGLDTTRQMQEILEAYAILSDTTKRMDYDRQIKGHVAQMQTFDLKSEDSLDSDGDVFVLYWKAADKLYEIISETGSLYRQKEKSSYLTQLSLQALTHILILREGAIPEKYWHPDIMNWLLFTWYKNRNITIAYLLTLYDEHLKRTVSPVEKLNLQRKSFQYSHSVKKLVKYS